VSEQKRGKERKYKYINKKYVIEIADGYILCVLGHLTCKYFASGVAAFASL
jgi:hypothetical protein